MSAHLALAFSDAETNAEVAARSLGRAARNLQKFRERTGLSIAKMARATGLPQSSIQAAENSGDDYLPFDVVEPMVPVLTRHGTSLAEILMLLVLPERLRLLRKSYPTLQVRYLAKLLGRKSGSGYQHYENRDRFDEDEFPNKVIIPLMREFRRVGVKQEELVTILPLRSFTALGKEISDLIGTDDTTIALIRRVLAEGQPEIELIAEAGKLVPVISGGGIKKLSIEMRASGSVQRTEESQQSWDAAGFVTGWKRVSDPHPFGFLMSVFTDDHSKHFTIGETLEIDRAVRDLEDGKHYLVVKGEEMRLGRYDSSRKAIVSEAKIGRSKVHVLPINDACIVVGKVVRSIAERTYD